MRLATILRCDRHKIIGHLHELWWWALDNVPVTGDMGDATTQEAGVAAGWPVKSAKEFGEALVAVGFIDRADDGHLTLHDWYDYAGKLMEQRERVRLGNAERQRNSRDRHGVTNATVTRDVTPRHAITVPDPTGPNPTRPKTKTNTGDAADAASVPTPEPLPFDDISDPPEWLLKLREIAHWPHDSRKDGVLMKWAKDKPPELLMAKATSMKGDIGWDETAKCWRYNNAKRFDLRAVFQDWVGNGTRGASNGNSTLRALNGQGLHTAGGKPPEAVTEAIRTRDAAQRAADAAGALAGGQAGAALPGGGRADPSPTPRAPSPFVGKPR